MSDTPDTKWVYNFGADRNEGGGAMKELLGGKGANLAEMSSIGLPVPPGFTITTAVCTAYYRDDKHCPAALPAQVDAALARVEAAVGARLGNEADPLLVSVRSGA
ncbi:MAG: pyruvate, phosphate dikinase, partial [Gluconacetobacter diazotrophicus]|nr:pyruvate, phosphate dikinase [Gluconacetobacter diazotrophicus]